MRVLMCPDFRATNPYQELLATAVSSHGITVEWGKHGRFALLYALRQKPDLIHLHWSAPFWLDSRPLRSRVSALRFLAELLWVKRQGVRVVWTLHNLHDHERTNPRLEHTVNRQICRLADQVLVHCAAVETAVLQTYRLPQTLRRNLTVTGHGSFIGMYANTISRAEARRRLALPADALVYLFFGQIRPYKGIPTLIDAFRQLRLPQAHLLIAGQPVNNALAQALSKSRANHPHLHLHLSHIPAEDIQQFMNAADVLVLPFEDIVTSSTLILGMSFGKALVAPAMGCLPQTVDSQGCCFYDGTANGLVAALQQVADDDRSHMGQHNLELAQKMDWQAIGRQTAEVYRRV